MSERTVTEVVRRVLGGGGICSSGDTKCHHRTGWGPSASACSVSGASGRPDREGPTWGWEQRAEGFSDTHVFPREGSVAALPARAPGVFGKMFKPQC